MVATSILSTDAEMVAMAGENVDATGFTDANKTAWGIQAEAFISLLANYDFPTNVATLTALLKPMLSEYVSRYVAVSAITYNMSGFLLGLIEAEDMIQIHIYRMEKIEKILSDPNKTALLGVK